MKMLKTIVCAIVLIAAFVTAKADMVINASGTIELQTTPGTNGTKAGFTTYSFNNKYVYNLISNAVAFASTNISTKPLPANGYIAFNPQASLGTAVGIFKVSPVTGVFYVTNKTGFYYSLSGYDEHGNYYSWMELDSQNGNGYGSGNFQFGWPDDLNGVASYNLNSKTSGNQALVSTAVLYIHDDPYCYDESDNPNILWSNNIMLGNGDDAVGNNLNAVEVRGVLTASAPTVGGVANISNFSVTGSGNAVFLPAGLIADPIRGIVKTGTAKFAR